MTYEHLINIPCPPEGLGVNNWCWYAAKSLFSRGVESIMATQIILEASTRTDPGIREREVRRAVERAYEGVEAQHKGDEEYYSQTNLDLARSVEILTPFIQGIDRLSPVPPALAIKEALILRQTYAVGKSVDDLHYWTPSQEAIDNEWQYICPNPLASKDAGRVRENIARRDYYVVEFDDAELSWQIAAHVMLALYAPLKAMVFSGNKSYHGLYKGPVSQEFIHAALSLGADKLVLNRPEQWVRFPGGKNGKTGNTQEVYTFN